VLNRLAGLYLLCGNSGFEAGTFLLVLMMIHPGWKILFSLGLKGFTVQQSRLTECREQNSYNKILRSAKASLK
jgi:hypothetical protein